MSVDSQSLEPKLLERRSAGQASVTAVNAPSSIWYDTHAHLLDEEYAEDRLFVLERAAAVGVGWINEIAYDWPSSLAVVAWARESMETSVGVRRPRCYAVVGIHPHNAVDWNEEVEAGLLDLLEAQEHNRIVAVGEIGLDYHYDHSPREVQKRVFRRQLEIAGQFQLPVVIHNREAHEEVWNLLREARANGWLLPEMPGVIHCYSGSPEMAERFLKLGFFLGFDGPITFKNAKDPCTCVERMPVDRLVLETDAPYLTPVPFRGTRNESSYLPLIGERAAALRGVEPGILAEQTRENAFRLFRISEKERSVSWMDWE